MNYDEIDFLPLRVIRECSNGKRRYDPEGKRRLIEACLQPGASIAGFALRAEVEANQLHKWIRLHGRADTARAARTASPRNSSSRNSATIPA
jgi:transposase